MAELVTHAYAINRSGPGESKPTLFSPLPNTAVAAGASVRPRDCLLGLGHVLQLDGPDSRNLVRARDKRPEILNWQQRQHTNVN